MRKRLPVPGSRAAFAGLAALALAALAAGAAPSQAVGQAVGPEALGFKQSFVVEIRNPGPAALENCAVVLDVPAIRAAAAWDFNTYMYALFEEKGIQTSFLMFLLRISDLHLESINCQVPTA